MNTSKQINIMVLLIFVSIFVTGAYTLWDPIRAEDAQDEQLEKTVDRGAFLFTQNCRVCHGNAGEGGAASNRLRQAPPLNRPDLQGRDQEGNRTDVAYANAYKLVYNTIVCGRVGKVMPAWAQSQGGTLNDEQIKQLTVLITEGTGWEHAQEYALRGDPEFHVVGDDQYSLSLGEALGEGDTTLALNNLVQGGSAVVAAGDQLSIVDEQGETVELFNVTEVSADTGTVTIERGVGNTSASEHAPGTEVLKPPVPPAEPAILERSCGQLAQAASTPVAEPPSTTLTIVAENIAWNKSQLSAIANAPLTITVDNRDTEAHNIAFFEGTAPEGDTIAATEIENGPVTQTLNFGPLTPGEYFYFCEVHPQMEGLLTATEPGAAPPAGGNATPATNDPAAGSAGDDDGAAPAGAAPVATGTAAP